MAVTLKKERTRKDPDDRTQDGVDRVNSEVFAPAFPPALLLLPACFRQSSIDFRNDFEIVFP